MGERLATAGSRAFTCERMQHSRGSSSGRFGGPDCYVAVQIVPEGVEPLEALRQDLAERRGIKIIQCGEGYKDNQGPRSALGRALAEADRIVEAHDAQQARILAARRGWDSLRRRRALALQSHELAL